MLGWPRDVTWQDKTVHTGIWKSAGRGTAHGTPSQHRWRRTRRPGGPWRRTPGRIGLSAGFLSIIGSTNWARNDFAYGQFGENFTVDGLADAEVCIGDRYRIGGALFEVTQPRVTCYRPGIRMNEPEMAALLVKHGRPGFYFRVLEEGERKGRRRNHAKSRPGPNG